MFVTRIAKKFISSQRICTVAVQVLPLILKIRRYDVFSVSPCRIHLVQRMISSQLELLRLSTGTQPRVVTAVTRLKQRLFQFV